MKKAVGIAIILLHVAASLSGCNTANNNSGDDRPIPGHIFFQLL